jgi:superfamily II DNA or RNA helicase
VGVAVSILQPRDYQLEAIAELHRRWDAGDTRVPMVLATGLGKTVIFAHLIADWTAANPSKRVIVLVHTDELVQQAYKKIKDVAPKLSVGIVKAERNDVTARVIVASVQSLRQAKRRAQIRQVGLIIVDECHHATAATYRAILEHYGALPCSDVSCDWMHGSSGNHGERIQVAGFTATLARGDKAKLSDIWQECTFKRGIAFGIRRGYLLDVRGKRVVIPDMDLGNVKKSGGDYAEGSLAEELDRSLAPSIVATAYGDHARGRKGLGFAPTVQSAHHFAEAFNEAGIPSAVVHGGTPREERRLILKQLHAGEIQVVWNCGVLTEGFDEPTVSCVVMARPTKSAPLYQQIIGRGLRPDLSLPAGDRGDCLVLDVVGASGRHDLRTLVDLSERRDDLDPEDIEDLSLIELEDALLEAEGEAQEITVEEYYGETATVDFDPLNRTGIGAWLQTDGGTYFLPAGEVYVLIAPGQEINTWDVAWLAQKANAPVNGSMGDLTEHQGLSLEMACSWAEEVVEDFGGRVLADRRQTWRRKEPSVGQVAWAARAGVDIEGKTRGEVSDLMSQHFASQRIDPIIGMLAVSRD